MKRLIFYVVAIFLTFTFLVKQANAAGDTVSFSGDITATEKGGVVWVKIKRTGNVSSSTAIILSELWSDNRTTTSKNEILYSPSTSTANVNSYDSSGRYATVVFKAKQKLVKIPYSITNDKLVESSERLYFRIKNAATGTTIGRRSTMYIRVKDDDVAPPTLSLVGGLLVEEGKSSTSYAKLSKALDTDVTFKVSTYKGAYKQANVKGEGGDYLGLTDKSFTIKARRTKVNIPVLTYKNTDPLDSKYESTLLCIESATVPSTVTLGTECDVITIYDVSVAAPPVVKPPPVVTTPPAPDGTPIVTTDLNIYATQVQQLASDIGNEKTAEVMCGEDTASLTKTLALWEKLSLGLLNLVFGNPDCAAAEEIKTVEDLPSLQKVQSTITNGVRIKVRRGEKMSFISPTYYLPNPNQPVYWTAFQANFLDHYFVRSGDYIDGKQIPLDLSELITLYGDYPGQVKVIGSDADLLVSSESFQGTKAIKVKSNLPNSSLKFHHINGWNTTNFGALTFAIKTDTPSLKIYPSLKLSDGGFMKTGVEVSNYIYGSVGSEWKVAWIPLRDLTANLGNVSISDVIFEFNSAGMVWLDEVKIREEFKLPLPGGKSWWLTVEAGGLAYDGWMDPYHSVDTSYFSLDFGPMISDGSVESNIPILAMASGKILVAKKDQYNGNYVVINHDFSDDAGIGYTTLYAHMKDDSLVVSVGDIVKRGQKLGVMGNTGESTGEHLHITFKFNGQRNSSTYALKFVEMEKLLIEDYNVIVGDPKEYYQSTNTAP